MKAGNGSSKYDFQPNLLDADVAEKSRLRKEEKEKLKDFVQNFFDREIKYRDGSMSRQQKQSIVLEVFAEIIEVK